MYGVSEGQTTEQILETALEQAATTPETASNETGSVSSRSIGDLIALDRYLSAKAAAKRRDRGLRIQRFEPPGTI